MKWIIKIGILVFIIAGALIPMETKAASMDYEELSPKLQVMPNKEWSIKFNSPLEQSTINSKNITVSDEGGKLVSVIVKIGEDGKTVIVGAPEGGYLPGQTYYLNFSGDVRAKQGAKLEKGVKMKFIISNNATGQGANLVNLPEIKQVDLSRRPIISSETQNISLSAKSSDKVQYRIFTFDYKTLKYEEITKGYTEPVNGDSIYTYSFSKSLNSSEEQEGKKYKLLVYIKRAGSDGAYKDQNTDYDSCYVDYFKCVKNIDKNELNTVTYTKSLKSVLPTQINGAVTDESGSFAKASANQILYYLNPDNFLDQYGKYQFLKLNYADGITAEDLNGILKGKGILEGQGETFLQAAKENDINAAYLVSHALLETGGGTSALAKGIEVKEINGQPLAESKISYNMFGIKAIDADPNKYGSEYAYSQGWFSAEDAIKGGAKFISTQYINNAQNRQDTLYKMRWNPEKPGVHQYATDIGWAYKQIKNVKSILDACKGAVLNYEVPIYSGY